MSEYKKDEITGLYPYDTVRNVDENRDLILVGHKYIDPFDPDKYLIFQEPDYFMKYYGLSKEQVWNICHGYDKDHLHLCKCGTKVKFINFKLGFSRYCCTFCARSDEMKERWSDEEYKNDMLSLLHSPETIALRNRTEFLQRGEETDECYLYLAFTQSYKYEWIKFGATEMAPYHKARRDLYLTIHPIYKGSRIEVANAEYNLSIKFQQEWFEYPRFKEFKEFYKESYRSGSLFDF